jgi:hypothetical protein
MRAPHTSARFGRGASRTRPSGAGFEAPDHPDWPEASGPHSRDSTKPSSINYSRIEGRQFRQFIPSTNPRTRPVFFFCLPVPIRVPQLAQLPESPAHQRGTNARATPIRPAPPCFLPISSETSGTQTGSAGLRPPPGSRREPPWVSR